MKRLFTATCFAATFAVGLAAQSTGTAGTAGATAPQDGQRGGGPRTITGCVRAGDTAGTFMLTDVVMPMGGRRGGDATAGGTTAGGTTACGTTAGGTTAGGTTAGGTTAGTATAGAPGQAMAPMSITLIADSTVDLKAHVGHKVEVTGTMAGGRGRQSGDAATTGTATGTTAGGTSTGGTATATGTGTSGTGTGAGTGTGTGAGAGQGGGRGPRSMTVTSVRMISESCS